MHNLLLLFILAASALSAGVPIRSHPPKDYQVYLMLGQSLIQSGAFSGDSAAINGREFDDQTLSFWQSRPDSGKKHERTLRYALNYGGDESTGFDSAFAREMYAQGERNIVIIRYAVGGHSIVCWVPSGDRLEPIPGGGQIDRVDLAKAFFADRLSWLTRRGDTYTLRGMVMWQGSSDRGTADLYNNYEAHLDFVKADYRAIYPNLKWLQVVSPDWDAAAGVLVVQGAQIDSSAGDADAAYVLSDPALGVTVSYSDGTHPLSADTERVGVQAARKLSALGW